MAAYLPLCRRSVRACIDLYRGLLNDDRSLVVHAYETWGFGGLSNELIDILNIWADFPSRPVRGWRWRHRRGPLRFPTLLDFPAPRIRAYPRETVVAEKLQAIIVLGIANSRMKDFYDLYVLARDFAFDGATLTAAIKATFKRRKTEIPHETPLALKEEFGRDDQKSVQWKAFVRKAGFQKDVPELQKVLLDLRKFLLLPLKAASEQDLIPKSWSAGGPSVSAKSEIENI